MPRLGRIHQGRVESEDSFVEALDAPCIYTFSDFMEIQIPETPTAASPSHTFAFSDKKK